MKKKFSLEKFIERAIGAHGNIYDYSLVEYVGSLTKVKIICLIHGIFEQLPSDHWYGRGCNQCARGLISKKLSFTTDEFIKRCIIIHNGRYDYSKVIYKNNKSKVEIICKKHGSFWQRPVYHFDGHGCQICARAGYSELERNWLNKLNIPQENRQHKLIINNKKIIADGFDPKTNTVYEFYGDYFHGNPKIHNPDDINEVIGKTFGEIYSLTIERETIIKQAGFNLIVKWETD